MTVLDEAQELVKGRIAELDDERKKLDRALTALGGNSKPARRPGRTRGPGRPRRRKGTRAEQAVKLIQDKPGISASDIAKAVKIKPNYLYRVLGDLEKEKRVRKEGRKYFPV